MSILAAVCGVRCAVYIVGSGDDVVEEVRLWWLRKLWRKAGELVR